MHFTVIGIEKEKKMVPICNDVQELWITCEGLVGKRSETLARPKNDSLITSQNRHSLSASRDILHLPMCGELGV